MFFKIAINNIKRSFQDYSIYFLTLTLGICLFYTFNSIEAQNSILEWNKNAEYISTLNQVMAVTSVFVSIVLGCLIIYANNFLIKKRKKELSIYMTLGMPKGTISKILLFEALFIGTLSLFVGLVLGIIMSQGMSVITANILGIDVEKFTFIISSSAVMKSVAYFGLIYLLVLVFNQVTISKYKLIDLLHAAKKNEEIKFKNPYLYSLLFLIAIGLLMTAYTSVLNNGLTDLATTVIIGALGTLFFFFSLSSFLILIVQKSKRIYLKDINIFVLRQLNNKINTNFMSMTVICLMLFLTITLLFTAFDLKGKIDKSEAAFDASAFLIVDDESENPKDNDIEAFLNQINFTFESYEQHAFYHEYTLDVTPEQLLATFLSEQQKTELQEDYSYQSAISAVKISDYNAMLKLKGQAAIHLKENELLVVSSRDYMNRALFHNENDANIVHLGDTAYTIKNEAPIKETINIRGYNDFFYLIIPDTYNGKLQLAHTGLNVIFDEQTAEKSEEKFANLFTSLDENQYKQISPALVIGGTWEQIQDRKNGEVSLFVFLSLFLGLIFLITSAAVIALQQLSDASDSVERYQSLKKIGVTEKLINDAIFKQMFIYFMAPLSLAIIHSVVGIRAVRDLFNFQYQGVIVSSLLLVVIYGCYFYATYVGVKNTVKN